MMDSEIILHFIIQIQNLVCSFHPSEVLAGRCCSAPGRVMLVGLAVLVV